MNNQTNIEVTTINGVEYYQADNVYTVNPKFFYGCANNPRNIISKKNIPNDCYVYAYDKKGILVTSTSKYLKAKLFLSKIWVDNNVDGFGDKGNNEAVFEMLPELIKLNDNEHFVGLDGEKMDVTIRGCREKRLFYFNVKDVSKAFDIPLLNKTLIDKKNNGYEETVHYTYFYFYKRSKSEKIKTEKTYSRSLYLTYVGLIRCLYVSRSKNADKFQVWATNILFVHQFGSADDKVQLASNLLGATPIVIKNFCKAAATPISCVYLFTLGTVKDLRQSMNIDSKYTDDMIVCKYGRTDDLNRRTVEHTKTYGSIPGCDLVLKYYSYIDPKYSSEAETYIHDQLDNCHIVFGNHKEIVVVNNGQLNDSLKNKTKNKLRDQFQFIEKKYSGTVDQLRYKISQIEHIMALEKEKHALVVEKYKNELLSRELIELKLRHEIDTLKRELTILNK